MRKLRAIKFTKNGNEKNCFTKKRALEINLIQEKKKSFNMLVVCFFTRTNLILTQKFIVT